MKNCVYYITGHGYGHATRSFSIIKKLLDTGFTVIIVSSLNQDFVQSNFVEYATNNNEKSKFSYEYRMLDSGAKQLGPLLIDLPATLHTYYHTIYNRHEQLINEEIKFLQLNQIDLIITDTTPLPCTAGKRLGIKTIMLTNLSWDFIFRDMLAEVLLSTPTTTTTTTTTVFTSTATPGAAPTAVNSNYVLSEVDKENYTNVVKQCTSDYLNVQYYFQLPGVTPFVSPFPSISTTILKCPLICREIKTSKTELLKKYDVVVDNNTYILLLSFGGFSFSLSEFELKDDYLPAGWICLLLGFRKSDYPSLSARYVCLPADTHVPDAVNACDACLGKIGYGTVSECLATQPVTPLIYIPRPGWPEEVSLLKILYHNNAGIEMTAADFFSGNWQPYLSHCLELKLKAKNYIPIEEVSENNNNNNKHLFYVGKDAVNWVADRIHELYV